MLISDLSHLDTISDSSSLKGSGDYGWYDYRSYIPDYKVDFSYNTASVVQDAYASAGNNSGKGNISIGNVALALNIAVVTQVNV
jgi:hypothetical protein